MSAPAGIIPVNDVRAPSVAFGGRGGSDVDVDAETPGVADAVRGIARLLADAGAFLDPRLVVLERSGHVTLASQDGRSGADFISLPTDALIPTDDLVWDDGSMDVSVVGGLDALTGMQRDLLDLHLALWNATGKRRTFLTSHPKATTEPSSALASAIGEIRPGFTPSTSTAALLRTRTFGLRGDDGTRTSVIMPILELADHHPQGAPYRMTDAGLGSQYCHVDETAITYVRYGPVRDAIDLACHYGFATDRTHLAVSAPLSLDLDGLGDLVIERALDRRAAPRWTADGARLSTPYLPLDARAGLYDSLYLPVRSFAEARGAGAERARDLAMRACSTVIHLNKELVRAVAEQAAASGTGGGPVLEAAAVHQWEVLDAVETLA